MPQEPVVVRWTAHALVDVGPYRIAYNHPADGDEAVALVVTVWRRA